MDSDETRALRQRIEELKVEHRNLDVSIAELSDYPGVDELQLRRMKKRKLLLKDIIARLQSKLLPDLNA